MPYLAAVVLAGAGAGAFATRASQPWGVALVGVVAVAVCALNAVRYTTMHRETERLYAELGRMAEIRRQLLGSMVRTLDADRCRTLTELHAQAVSSLTSLATLARSAQAALPGEAARAFRQTAGDLQRDAERRAEELRRLVVALRPAVVPLGTAPMRPDQDGLADVLRAYAADLASGSAPAVHVRVASGLELDRATLAVAYRILQEALLRAVRRTRATTVTVAVAEEAGGVALEVRDDGMPSAGRYDGREWGKIRLLCELGRGHLTVQPDGAGGAGGTVMRAVLGGPTARGEASSDGGALPTTPRPRHLRLVRPVSDGAQGRGAGRSQPAGRGSEQSE
jgi:signal transduction histidine kinase